MVYAKRPRATTSKAACIRVRFFLYLQEKVTLLVSKEWIHPGDRVLVIDDFLARGEALRGLCEIVQAAGLSWSVSAARSKGLPGRRRQAARGGREPALSRHHRKRGAGQHRIPGGSIMETVLILDFGAQYSQLIARRVREQNVYCEVKPCSISPAEIENRPHRHHSLRRPAERL